MMEEQVPAPDDVELVASIQSGHSGAEAALYEKNAARIYYLALRESRLPHDAEDARAETFLRAFQAIRGNHLRSAASLGAFILGTTRTVWHELFLRRRQACHSTQHEN